MKINLMSEANKAILHCWKLDRDEAVVYFLSLQGPLPWAKNVIKVKQHSVREEKSETTTGYCSLDVRSCYGVSTEEARVRCKFDRARARNHDIMRCGDWSPTLISV
uniref:Uncharacterized protein n=1 Tax=Vespula pensylvanica TaxID=30213 RepID=A0A834NZL3_VESPE|nr:hypothetical protein H0235_009829 [Vespula pensylvanica]